MDETLRSIPGRFLKLFAPKPKSKAERYGLKGGVPFVNTPQPADNTPRVTHPEDEYLFGEKGHEPIPIRHPDDELGQLPPIPPEVSGSLVDVLAPLEIIPGIREVKSLLKQVHDQLTGDNRLAKDIATLQSDCSRLFVQVMELNPSSAKFNEEVTRMRVELKNTLAHVDHWGKNEREIELRHRHAIIKRVMRCRVAYERIEQQFLVIQGSETLSVVREIQSHQNKTYVTKLEEELQATEAELQKILRRETGKNIPSQIILQERIKYRCPESYCTPHRFSVYKGELISGEQVAIKVSEKKPSLHDDDGRNFGRRILRHAATWASFDNKYILPFLGMGVQIIKRQQDGGRYYYKVYFVSPWLSDGNAVDFIRKAHEQGLHIDISELVRDVALGLQYLHGLTEPCVHGSVRGENVLIRMDEGKEQACLNGFALTKKQVRDNTKIEYTGEDGICRWKSPEIIDSPFENPRMEPSSDIWAWAMTALQLYSGLEPYYQHTKTHKICMDITSGKLPARDEYPDFDKYAPLPDMTWSLFQKCWNMDPEERPTIQGVIAELNRINDSFRRESN